MSKIRISNVQFEWELSQKNRQDLSSSFLIHPIYLQLQFLSFLYAHPDDLIITTHNPDPDYMQRLKKAGICPAKNALFSSHNIPKYDIDCWGMTPSIASWAKKNNIPFIMPEWNVVQQVNSKEFSYTQAPKLNTSALIHNISEAEEWIKKIEGPKVFKSIYGLSGRGHFFLTDDLSLKGLSFLQNQWQQHHPVIAEPWVDRVLDFSTQWYIHPSREIEYIGATLCKNDVKGSYHFSLILKDDSIGQEHDELLHEHRSTAYEVLATMASLGYFGHVGFDAMIYKKNNTLHLHPIVEINARKTMGWVALMLQRRFFSDSNIIMYFNNEQQDKNLLPNFILSNHGKNTLFSKVLHIEIVHENKSWKDIYF
jgi:hypothetical protein